MSVSTQVVFPGIYFEVEEPPVREALPRMDIAAFVGFASAGPLHTPVAVEDIQRYRELFGPDLDLAWDARRNTSVKSCLGSAVDAFFRNGGQRCWVVRVADESLATTARFELPGLVRTDGNRVEKVWAEARSPGSWAQPLRTNTVLRVTQLPLDRAVPSEPYFEFASSGWSARLVADQSAVRPGDLLRVRPGEGTTLYLAVATVQATSSGISLSGQNAWLSYAAGLDSPDVLDVGLSIPLGAEFDPAAEDAPVLFDHSVFDTLGVSQAWSSEPASPDDSLFSVELLGFDWSVNDSHKQRWRLERLGLHPEHPRFWGRLPADSVLFWRGEGRPRERLDIDSQALVDEASNPRFPLCSDFSDSVAEHAWTYLPLGLGAIADPERSTRADIAELGESPFLDGVENMGSRIFLDERLATIGSALLRQEANQIAFLGGDAEPLKGIHSLIPIEEATLLAVPDAIHRRWDDIAPERELPLAAPELFAVASSESNAEYLVTWSEVDDATRYRLAWSEDPDFTSSDTVVVAGEAVTDSVVAAQLEPPPPTEHWLDFDPACPRELYFRVRAESREEVSPWSNNLARFIPGTDFVACDAAPAAILDLVLELDASSLGALTSPADSGGDVYGLLLAQPLDGSPAFAPLEDSLIDTVEIQRSREHSFLETEVLFSGNWAELDITGEGISRLDIEIVPDTTFYYRARGTGRGTVGPWSNTLTISPVNLGQSLLQPEEDFSDTDLLAVQRAVLRLCAARGDVFGLLSLPLHYQVEQVQKHMARLGPGSDEVEDSGFTGDPLSARVLPLGFGETAALSHGGLYYPWLACQTDSQNAAGVAIRAVPPDGPVLGQLAGTAIARGAWIAPANTPINSALALANEVSKTQWAGLLQARVNVIREDARGFLLLSADTLSRNSELAEISVRRLMSLVSRLALREGSRYVFEPNNANLAERVQLWFEAQFDQLFNRGAFAGRNSREAYRVVTDSTVNSRQGLEAGRFIVELHVAPSQPLKFLRVRLVQAGANQLHIQEVSG